MRCPKELILFATACLVFLVSKVDAIRCFDCTSLNPGCDQLSANNTDSPYLINCKEKGAFCRKTIYKIIDNDRYTRIARSCGTELYKGNTTNCYENDDDFKFERSCQCFEDGCNSSQSLSLNLLLIAAASVYRICSLF